MMFDQSTKDRICEILLSSEARSGPFDGGCLIFARGLIQGLGRGELVRISSRHFEAEHYGVLVDGFFIDMDGCAESADEWISRFASNENMDPGSLRVAAGYVDEGLVPEDPAASKLIGSVICYNQPTILSK